VARLCRDLGVGSLKVNPVQPIGRGAGLHGNNTGIESILSFARDIHETCGRSVTVDVPPAFLPVNRLKESGRCPLQNLLGVLANGDVSFCGIGFICGELVMGNFITEELENIWRDHPLLQKVRTLLPGKLEGICGNCVHKGICLGSCVMQNYYSTGSFTAPFWVCSRAEENGLFPETRKIRPDA
ncbi:MAG: SPASM domain-containing protein, partial [Candidatus Aegiribacteria sp.]